jgi:hypothetical protein
VKRPSQVARYIRENVYSRCGQVVTRLAEAGLLPRPEMADSELEVHEWWLVSPQAAGALREAGEPVLQFCELFMWGRTHAPGRLEDDAALARVALRAAPG